MKPDATAPSTALEGPQRRRVRLFVALHLGAVGTIYALALIVGGGFGGLPMPPLTGAPASAAGPSPAPEHAVQHPPVVTSAATALPEWARRTEITLPLESR